MHHLSRPQIPPRWPGRSSGALAAAVLVGAALAAGFAAPPAAAQGNAFGMNIHEPTGSDLTLIMNKLQAAGIGWANMSIVWPYVQPTQGAYDWSTYDAIVAAAKAHGITLLASPLYTPDWAASAPAPTWTAVPTTAAWMDFCTQAATHFKGSIQYWQIWNEPNQAEFWAGTRQQYIDQLLIPCADAIHAADPTAQVGGPALAHLTSADWYDWLTDVLQQAGPHLDFVTHHTYDTGGNKNVTQKLTASTLFGGSPDLWSLSPPSVREVLQYVGWFGKPFWLTETGWESQPIGEAQQAAYYTGMLNDWFSGQSGQTWMTRIFFYEMQDPPNSSTWGILNADGTPKEAYSAYQTFISGQAPPPPAADNATLVSANLPVTMDAGQTITVRLTFQNSGTSTWTAANNYKLGAVGDNDPFAAARQLLSASQRIAPGQQVTFSFPFTAPATAGTYTSSWQMLREGVTWFGATTTQQVTVNPAPPAAERTLALLDQRFAVTVSWHDPTSGNAGDGIAVPDTDETGTFWFFSSTQADLAAKFVDGRAVNNHFWFFYGALTNVEYWITVTDLLRGTTATYYNPPGNLCGQADTSTFGDEHSSGKRAPAGAVSVSVPAAASDGEAAARGPAAEKPLAWRWMQVAAAPPVATPAAAAAPSCAGSAQDLCLFGDRFQVSVTWQTPYGTTGAGMAETSNEDSGTFSFFDPSAIDLVVKVVDGRSVTGKFWFFYGALTNVAYTITLTDTVTGSSKQYQNAQGNLCGLGDTSALN